MPTNTWQTNSFSIGGALAGGPLPTLDVFPPAGSIIKRFQVRNVFFLGVQSGVSVTALGGAVLLQQVLWGPSGLPTRSLYQAAKRLPSNIAALYDPATLQRIYSQQYEAGDLELGVNQPCSFGKHTEITPWQVRLTSYLYPVGEGFQFNPSGQVSLEFAVLHESLP